MHSSSTSSSQAGFTLVEIALAMLVLAVGMVVLLGLFPAALSVNKGSIDETRSAIFAEDVLNAVKAAAAETPWDQINSMTIVPPVADIWRDANDLRITPGPGVKVNRYVLKRGSNINEVETAVIKYKLEMAPYEQGRIWGVKLQVVNGEYANIADGQIYYTELYYNGL